MSKYWGEYIHINLNLFKSENVVLCWLSFLGIKGLGPVCCILSLYPPAILGFLDSSIFNLNELYYFFEALPLPFFLSLPYTPLPLFCKLVDKLRDYWILLFSWNTKGMFCLSMFVAVLDWWSWRSIYANCIGQQLQCDFFCSIPWDAGQRVVFKDRSKQ